MNTQTTTEDTAYTSEHWYYESDGDGTPLAHRDKYIVASNGGGRVLTLDTPHGASQREVRNNGLRIASLINLFHGVADPAAEITKLRKDREDLLAKLKALSDWGRTHTSPLDKNSPHELLIDAVNAISAVTGGAA